MNFSIKERHGFNKTTIKIFVTDIVKKISLTFILGGPIIALLLFVIEWGGPNFYIYVFVLIIGLMFFFMWLFPNFIQPLFNKYEDLEEGDLRSAIEDLAKS